MKFRNTDLLSALGLQYFKSIGNQISLNLKPLTILVGPNGSGKSNIMEAIALISQSIPERGNPLILDDTLVKYPSYNSIFHKKDKSLPLQFSMTIQLTENEYSRYLKSLSALNLKHPGASRFSECSLTYEYTFRFPEGIPEQCYTVHQSIEFYKGVFVRATREYISNSFIESVESPLFDGAVRPIHSGSQDEVLSAKPFAISGLPDKRSQLFNELVTTVIEFFRKRLEDKVKILNSSRGRIEYSVGSEKNYDWVGANGEHLLQILSKIFSSIENRNVKDKIVQWASKFGITDLTSGWTGTNLSSDFYDETLGVPLNVALAGYGSRQALAMISQLFWSKKGDLILIEEPEISLHPAGTNSSARAICDYNKGTEIFSCNDS